MNVSGNTILITGGASGIGLALAWRFYGKGNQIVICGRREDKLTEASQRMPGLRTYFCDVGDAADRERFAGQIVEEVPELNVLVNNAGIQRRIDLREQEDWQLTHSEIAINLEAPIHLSQLLYPHLSGRPNAAIVNVTSGLSFVPLASVPVYSATKAALHSFTLSLRHQLRDTGVEVIEIIPPAVDTDLQAPGLHTFGVNVDEFADHVFAELQAGKLEIAYGTAAISNHSSREELDVIFQRMNESPPFSNE